MTKGGLRQAVLLDPLVFFGVGGIKGNKGVTFDMLSGDRQGGHRIRPPIFKGGGVELQEEASVDEDGGGTKGCALALSVGSRFALGIQDGD